MGHCHGGWGRSEVHWERPAKATPHTFVGGELRAVHQLEEHRGVVGLEASDGLGPAWGQALPAFGGRGWGELMFTCSLAGRFPLPVKREYVERLFLTFSSPT